MNIQLQVCGLLMLVLLLVFYKSHRTLNLYPERVFFRTIFITLLTVLFDALSVVYISFSNVIPIIYVKLVCRIYLSLLIWSAWAVFTYILLDFSRLSDQRNITRISCYFSIFATVVIFFHPLEIFYSENVVYIYGATVMTTYYICAAYVLTSFIISLVLLIKKHSRRAFGGVLLNFIWAGAACIQFFNNELLLVGFSQCLGMLILFVLMENPESYIDKEYNSFNTFGLKPFVNDFYEKKQVFHIAQAYIENNAFLASAGYDVDEIIRTFISSISKQEDTYVFKDTACSMTFITTNEDRLNKCLKTIVKTKHAAKYLKGYTKLVSFRHAEKLSDYAELADLFAYVKSTCINRIVEYVEINNEIIKRHHEENNVNRLIDEAIEDDRVEVFLQPIFSNHDKRFTSAEALARIRLKDGNLLSPGIFIPLAEKTGQIILLGYRILEKILEFISSNNLDELGLEYLEVNLSLRQCEQEDLFDNIMKMVHKYNVDPKYINFEITESASIITKEIISANIQKLHEAGFTLSIDDFGKGESNLMYVVDMPVNLVKFDMDFTKAYFDSYKAKSIMRAIIPMAHELDLKLVSEGIENAKELETLCAESVDYIQGYYFSKPLPINEFIDFIKTY